MIKKWNWPLSIFAVINCIILYMIGNYFTGLGQGMGIIAVIVYPIYILIFTIIVIIFAIIKRKVWFTKGIIFSTIILLSFCTPLPMVLGLSLDQPSITTFVESSYDMDNHTSNKTEKDRSHGKTIAVRHWIKEDSDVDYLKHGIWVQLDEEGDTTKTETYDHGILMVEG
jgi:hypothetical protein